MERVRRRWWTALVSVFAALVIVAATLSGLFQLAVFALPSYRSDLSAWVTQAAGRPVQIGGISLVWRSFIPQVDLSDITLYAPDSEREVLTADRLSLGFGLLRLLRGDLTPTAMELAGVSLDARIDESGRLHVTGFEAPGRNADVSQWLKQLSRFERLGLKHCEVDLAAPFLKGPALRLQLDHALIRKTAAGASIHALLIPPAAYAQQIKVEGQLADPLDVPDRWSGHIKTTLVDVQPHPWLHGRLRPDTQVLIGKTRLEIVSRIAQGRLSVLEGHLEAANLQVKRSAQVTALQSLDLRGQAVPMPQGWQLQVTQLDVDGDNQLRGLVNLVPGVDQSLDIAADAELLRLDRLMPWLAYVELPPALQTVLPRATGTLTALQLRLTHQPQPAASRYLLQTRIERLGLTPTMVDAGFAGLSGTLTASEAGGRLAPSAGVTLHLPKAFPVPVPFERIEGIVEWEPLAGGWQLRMPTFAWTAAGTQGSGNVTLLLPVNGGSPTLDLAARFRVADVTALKPYMPLHWGAPLREWLRRAILSGEVPNGELLIRGPLADFPYVTKPTGRWRLDADARRIDLAYLPDWPTIRQIGAQLRFQGNGLEVTARTGSIAGNPLEIATARFRDFHRPLLEIEGKVNGEFARFYDFVEHSPLRKMLAGLMDNTRATGKGAVSVRLDIPMGALHDTQKLQVSGAVQLSGVDLLYRRLGRSITGLAGRVNFNAQGVTADKLTGRFEDLALTGRIEPRAQTQGVIRAEFDYGVNPQGSGASAFVPESIRHLLNGATHWRAELPLGAADGGLTLSSDLIGLALALPEPLGKAPSQSVPLTLRIRDGAANRTQVHLAYGHRLNGDIGIVKAGKGWKAQAINLVLGGEAAPPAVQPGLFISGIVKTADIGIWGAVLKNASGGPLPLMKADLQIDHAYFASQSIRDVRTVFKPDAKGWTAQLSGAGAEGDLRWRDADNGRLSAQLNHLRLELKGSALAAEVPEPESVFDPNTLPVLDVDCEHTTVGGQDLGSLTLRTHRTEGGQRVETLKVGSGLLQLGAQGEWKRVNDQSSAALQFELQTDEATTVLTALGFTPNLEAKESKFTGNLHWLPSAEGIEWTMARGRVDMALQDGTIKSVEPGVGRVLGLLNFFALPRRFLFDFGDVVDDGLAFDSVKGGFDLADGNARTQDLEIEGPSMNMEIRGRIGLVAHDFDQQVSVHPDYSTGITVGATVAGGPIGGVIALLAQQLFQKPIDKLTEMHYRITGPWDNPKIESGEAP